MVQGVWNLSWLPSTFALVEELCLDILVDRTVHGSTRGRGGRTEEKRNRQLRVDI